MKKSNNQISMFENVRDQSEKEVLNSNYGPYMMSVITSRALPAIDGFKPAHRKIIYTMFTMGLLNGDRTKSANIAGAAMKLNPHSDSSNYETMVRLTQNNETLLMPFIDGKGNFGKHYSRDIAFAASRYTEAKLTPICGEFLREIGENAVDMVDNYDGTTKEPALMPVPYPNILASANMGIAVGMACNFPGFNFEELCNATAEYIRNPDGDIMDIMPAPDFPGGGEILYNKDQMREIYRTGRGAFTVRSVWKYDEKKHCISISEIPYNVTVEAIIDKIKEMMKAGKLPDVTDVKNSIDLKGLSITIDVKRGTDIEKLMHKLQNNTPLTSTFSCNFNVLIDGLPKVLGVQGLLDEWLRFRVGCKQRVLTSELNTNRNRLHVLYGLQKILLDIDKAIALIRQSKTDEEVIRNLMTGFDIDEMQAQYVADIKLRNLNQDYILKQTKAIEGLEARNAEIEKLLASEKKVRELIAKELTALAKKYPSERHTKIVEMTQEHIEMLSVEHMGDENKLTATNDWYLRRGRTGDFEMKEDDELIVFTDKVAAYKRRVIEIPCTDTYVGSICEIESGEKPIAHFILDKDKYVACGYENGKISLYKMSDYLTQNNRKKLKNAYSDFSPCVGVRMVTAEDTIVAATSKDRKIKVKVCDLSVQGKGSRGIQAVKLKKNEMLTGITVFQK